jgi:hypothetical protein
MADEHAGEGKNGREGRGGERRSSIIERILLVFSVSCMSRKAAR